MTNTYNFVTIACASAWVYGVHAWGVWECVCGDGWGVCVWEYANLYMGV